MRSRLPLAVLTALAACGGCTRPAARPERAPPPPATVAAQCGLVIEDLAPGAGSPCAPGATVVINFTARLADGTVYDSSDMRKRPLTLPLSSPDLIRGLKEGIPGMRVGGKRRLRIPWQLAYGEQGRDPIPPKTDLLFEIELLSIDSAPSAPPR